MDVFEEMIRDSGADPETVSLAHILKLARFYANVEMAKVKLGRAEVTADEVRETAMNPETVGDRALTARTIRAGESRYIWFLTGCGCYDRWFADQRLTNTLHLDDGDKDTLLATPWPTNKRQAGRPGKSGDFKKMFAAYVEFRRVADMAPSREKVVELLTRRDRDNNKIAGITPLVVLPAGKVSHRTITGMLQWADENVPELIAEARRQGEIAKADGKPDAAFMDMIMDVRAILENPAAVRSMLKAARRQKRNK